MNCRGIDVTYHTTSQMPHPQAPWVHTVSNTLYWSLAVTDLTSSHTAATVSGLYTCSCATTATQCLLVKLVHVAVPWIAFIVCCPHLPDWQHIIWCSPLARCSSAWLLPSPPPAVNKPTWLRRLTLCCMHLPWLLSMAYYACSRTNSKTSFRFLLPVSH